MRIEDSENLFGFAIFQMNHRADPRKNTGPGAAAGLIRLLGKPECFFAQQIKAIFQKQNIRMFVHELPSAVAGLADKLILRQKRLQLFTH